MTVIENSNRVNFRERKHKEKLIWNLKSAMDKWQSSVFRYLFFLYRQCAFILYVLTFHLTSQKNKTLCDWWYSLNTHISYSVGHSQIEPQTSLLSWWKSVITYLIYKFPILKYHIGKQIDETKVKVAVNLFPIYVTSNILFNFIVIFKYILYSITDSFKTINNLRY